MKRIFKKLSLILILIVLIIVVNYNVNKKNEKNYSDLEIIYIIDGLESELINYEDFPKAPDKENKKFLYWMDESGNKINFDSLESTQVKLYAKYELNYSQLFNKITQDVVSSNIKIEVTNHNNNNKNIKSGIGSGVIFYETEDTYYVLTNEHVTKSNGRKNQKFNLIDYKGNEYEGKKLHEYPLYDLAILYFNKGTEKLNVLKLVDNNPAITEEVIAIGQPKGQMNAVTFGNILDYKNVKLTNGFNPLFPVISHNAPINNGSSGGVLLNSELNIIGINFSGSFEEDGSFKEGFAIPIEIINDYLINIDFK